MEKFSVLVIDDNRQWCELLRNELVKYPNFNVPRPLYDGRAAIEFIKEYKPDVLILDMLLPIYDGLYVINHVRFKMTGYSPFIYVISALSINKTSGVDYYSIKPIKAKAVASNLHNLLSPDTKQAARSPLSPLRFSGASIDVDKQIDDYLYDLGAPLYRLSTTCGHKALRIGLLDESMLHSVTSIYQIVSEHSEPPSTPGAVERNIRSMVLNIRNKANSYFTQCFPDAVKKLSNSQFINTSVYVLRRRIEDYLK